MNPNRLGIQTLPIMTSYPMSSLLSSYTRLAASERAKTANFIQKMNWERAIDASHTVLGLGVNPNFEGERSKAVRGAWQYERERIRRGFKTTRPFSDEQKKHIAQFGKLRGSEGYSEATVHHKQNVHDHPLEQANPDNTQICITTKEHLEAHNGNFRNETNARFKKDWQNKDIIKQTEKRIDRAEMKTLGIVAVISFVTASSITLVVELYKNGNNPESLKKAKRDALESGVEALGITFITYAIAQKILEPATEKISSLLIKLGFNISEKAVQTSIIGTIVILISSTYTYFKLRANGYKPRQALIEVGKQAITSVLLLIAEVWIINISGGTAGIIFSVICTLAIMGYTIYSIHVDKELRQRIVYAIEGRQYQLALSTCA